MKDLSQQLDQIVMWFDCNFITKSVKINEQLKGFLGLVNSEFSFDEWEMLIHPDDVEQSKHLLGKYLNGSSNTFDSYFRMRVAPKGYSPIRCRGTLVKDNTERPEAIIGTITPPSDFHELQTKVQLEEAIEELDTFFYRASHDLRAPVLAIEGVYNLLKTQPQFRNNSILTLLGTQLGKIKNLNADIIKIGKIRAKSPEPEEINLEALLSKIVAGFYKEPINISLKGLQNVFVFTDVLLLTATLQAIIQNSITYRDPKKASSTIDILAIGESDNPKLIIKDNGIGIREDLQYKIFEMFSRVSDKSIGSGLGLYGVSIACRKMDVTIEMNSEEFVGTEVILKF